MRAFETGTALLLLSLNGSHVVAQTQAPLPPTRSIATPSRNREMGGLSERPPPSIRAIARCERRAHCHLQTLLLAQPRKKNHHAQRDASIHRLISLVARFEMRVGPFSPKPGKRVQYPPFAELVCLSRSSVADEYYAGRSGNRWVSEAK